MLQGAVKVPLPLPPLVAWDNRTQLKGQGLTERDVKEEKPRGACKFSLECYCGMAVAKSLRIPPALCAHCIGMKVEDPKKGRHLPEAPTHCAQ